MSVVVSIVLWAGAHWWEILLAWLAVATALGVLLGRMSRSDRDPLAQSPEVAVRSSREPSGSKGH